MKLFFSERLACSSCHRGFNFSGPVQYAGGKPAPAALHLGVLSTRDRFRVPTLRNVALTAPYMHDGSIATLEAVIDRYDTVRRLSLSSVEKSELLAFLGTLTDEEFVR